MYGYKPVLGLTDFPITNLVKNGNFANGTTGWVPSSCTISADNNVLTATGDGSGIYVRVHQKTTNFTIGNKIYVKCKITFLSDNADSVVLLISDGVGHGVSTTVLTNAETNTPYNISAVLTVESSFLANNSNLVQVYARYSAGGLNKQYKLENFISIDLTSTFGAGNEPTVEEMDELITYFPNSWFDGTVNLADYKWFMIYFLKQIRTLKTAVVGLGGTV